jgi:RNA polymerase sigma-70 factor (ECF subfamily)
MPRRPMDPQERDLLRLLAIQSGDSASLIALYDSYAPLLYSVCASILPNAIDVQQAFRETWRSIWKRASTYNRLEGTVELWLVHLVRERALERLRQIEAPSEAEELVTRSRGTLGVPSAQSTPEREAARTALEALPALERQAIELAFFRALNCDELAQRLEAPASSVRLWQRQGLEKLSRSQQIGELV